MRHPPLLVFGKKRLNNEKCCKSNDYLVFIVLLRVCRGVPRETSLDKILGDYPLFRGFLSPFELPSNRQDVKMKYFSATLAFALLFAAILTAATFGETVVVHEDWHG